MRYIKIPTAHLADDYVRRIATKHQKHHKQQIENQTDQQPYHQITMYRSRAKRIEIIKQCSHVVVDTFGAEMITQSQFSCSETLTDATDFRHTFQVQDLSSETGRSLQLSPQTTNEAIDNFLTYPSFSTKQMALEMLWKQISQTSAAAIMQKSGRS